MVMESILAFSQLTGVAPAWIAIIILWSLVWKGFALWKSAQLGQKYWFMAILLVNSAGILDIIYLFFVAKKYEVEVEIVKENQ